VHIVRSCGLIESLGPSSAQNESINVLKNSLAQEKTVFVWQVIQATHLITTELWLGDK
jgi:hypothetical protein